MHDCTFLGLHKWHDHMFEHLGWMAMAKKNNNHLKMDAFLDGINKLSNCLVRKLENTRDFDRKQDLEILLNNLMCLKDCANAICNNLHIDGEKIKCVGGQAQDATNCGLAHWMRAKLEKLGWMCLAMDNGNYLKVNAYLDSIQRLRASLEKKIKNVVESDRKDDLKILHHDICILQSVANLLLSNERNTHNIQMPIPVLQSPTPMPVFNQQHNYCEQQPQQPQQQPILIPNSLESLQELIPQPLLINPNPHPQVFHTPLAPVAPIPTSPAYFHLHHKRKQHHTKKANRK